MLELSALGLLQREPLHGYKLKQKLEMFMDCSISVNYGAIYPLLRRLQQQGSIVAVESNDGEGRGGKKVYQITEQGRVRWREKMMEHPQESWVNARSRFAIKFFFFSDLEPQARIDLMEHRLMVCKLRQQEVEKEYIPQVPNDPYKQAIVQRHLETLNHEIEWLSQQLTREYAEKQPNS
ncbi:PadR family transcriptional regulator [Geitlerinema sp. PCC 9228]|jgi:DNA-binding PadR family transcriptional regulator|uniref:PadR family transcriptional regulator n=1 Tax=Geitlerinema sp. PCC 9228 TaxID=111611 RepID=UPI0008F9D918|nr:PadR family transcriptional regulator [Geitlerinema sp. PCC 9228]